MTKLSRFGAGVLLLAALGCVQKDGSDPAAAGREALMEADRAFNRDTQERGADGWADWFAEDGVMFPSSGRVDGRESIRESMRGAFTDENPRLVWEPVEASVSASGDQGYTIGRWRSVGRGTAGVDSVLSRGYYLTVWKYVPAEGWRVAVDMGNRDAARAIPEDAVEQASGAIGTFKTILIKALTDAMAKGPVEAIGVCNQDAPGLAAIASSLRATSGAKLGRTSHRLRNPGNAPEPWMRPILSDYVAAPDVAAPRAVWVDANTVGYTVPIKVGAMCLACHGKSVAAPIAERLDALYPEDNARGFDEGDFRGMFWATVPVGDIPPGQ